MKIPHITLQTGHTRTIEDGEVTAETQEALQPWLDRVLDAGGEPVPLPAGLTEYAATAARLGSAITVSVFGLTTGAPIVSLGVAADEGDAGTLWSALHRQPELPPAAPGLEQPAAPWCAVVLWPTSVMHPDALEWLGDLERCLAWCWASRFIKQATKH